MNDIATDAVSIEKEVFQVDNLNKVTQVVGSVVIILGAAKIMHMGYKAVINRKVRKELKKNKK